MPKMTAAEREEELDVLKMICEETFDKLMLDQTFAFWRCGFIHVTACIDTKKYSWCVGGFANVSDPDSILKEIMKLDPRIVEGHINWD